MTWSVSLPVILAATAASLLSPPARAEPPPDAPQPLVQIYGTLVPFLEYGHTTGATRPGAVGASQVAPAAYTGINAPARFRMDVGTSNLGFLGGIDLTDNLAVVWQIESGLQFDGGTVPNTNTIASRNSHLGLKGPWGTAIVGSWDTPYKWATLITVNPIAAGFIPDYTGILSNPGFGVSAVTTQAGRVNGAADAAFERRQGNSIQYWSPLFLNGVSVRLAYSIDEGRTVTTPMAPSIKPSLFSGWLGYDNGPLRLRYTLEAHLDYFGMSQLGGSPGATNTNRSSTDVGHRGLVQYTHATPGFDTRVVGVFEYLSYKNDDTNMNAIDSHSRAAYYGLVDQTLFGKHHIWLGFGQALDGSCSIVSGAPCSTAGLGATDAVLGYVYRAAKGIDFYAAAYRITNHASASYSTFPPLGGPAAPGADVESFGIGMLYNFSATIAKGSHRAPPAPAPPMAAPEPPPTPPPPATPEPVAPPAPPSP